MRSATQGAYRLTERLDDLDLDRVHRVLAEESYWAAGRPRAIVEGSFRNSRVVGALTAEGETVGFARAVTDGFTFGWICDVWVDDEHRGQGLARTLVGYLVGAPDLTRVRRWVLATRDAHGVYEPLGFEPLRAPNRWMERFREHLEEDER